MRIPKVKHLGINGWYSTPSPDFGDLSSRDYLRGRSWDEQMREGLNILRSKEALK